MLLATGDERKENPLVAGGGAADVDAGGSVIDDATVSLEETTGAEASGSLSASSLDGDGIKKLKPEVAGAAEDSVVVVGCGAAGAPAMKEKPLVGAGAAGAGGPAQPARLYRKGGDPVA